MVTRYPLAMTACNDLLYVICDDGTLWPWDAVDSSWIKQFKAIPGTPAGEEERKKKEKKKKKSTAR